MKRIIVIFLLFVASMLLFAEWKESYFVDDFGDPTDSRFAYISGYGQFSNSATLNSKMYYRVLVCPYSGDNTEGVTSLKIRFDLHDYSFDIPVHSYYSDTCAYYSIKDDNGNIYSFFKDNALTSWNSVIGSEAVEIYRLMLSNKTLKVAVSVESAKYVFTIDCEGVREVVEPIVANMQQKYPLGVWSLSKSQFSFDDMSDWIYCSVFSNAGNYVVKTILSGHTSKEPEISFSTHQCLEGFVTNDCLSGYIQATFTTSNGSVVYKTKGFSIECNLFKLFDLLRDADILKVELLVADETVSYELDAKEFLEHLELFEVFVSSLEKAGNVTSSNAPSCQYSETNQETLTNGAAPIEKGDYGGIILASVSIPFEYRGSFNFYLLRHKMVMPYVAFELLGSEFSIPIGITYVPIEGVLLFSGVELGRNIGIQAGVTLFYKSVATSVCASYDLANNRSYISLGLGFGGYNREPYRKKLF